MYYIVLYLNTAVQNMGYFQTLGMLEFRISALNMNIKEDQECEATNATEMALKTKLPMTNINAPDQSRKESLLKRITESKLIHIMYIFVLVLLTILWFSLAITCIHLAMKNSSDIIQHDQTKPKIMKHEKEGNTTLSTEDSQAAKPDQDDTFLCDYKIRQMGNVHRHTVQCAFSIDTNEANHNRMYTAPEINAVVCGVVALLQFLHLIYTALISPLINESYSRRLMTELDLAGQNVLCSDLNILLMKKEQ